MRSSFGADFTRALRSLFSMILALLLDLLSLTYPVDATCVIDWNNCKEATCFGIRDRRKMLELRHVNDPTPSTGFMLTYHGATTSIGIQVELAGGAVMKDDDYAALLVDGQRLGGCHKSDNLTFNIGGYPDSPMKIVDNTQRAQYEDGSFCCRVDVRQLQRLEFLGVHTSAPIRLEYTTGGKATTVTLDADASAREIVDGFAYRAGIACRFAAFRLTEKELAEGLVTYFPMKNASLEFCPYGNTLMKMTREGLRGLVTGWLQCAASGEWTVIGMELGDDERFYCAPPAVQPRRACAGRPPPKEAPCKSGCGLMNSTHFLCAKGAQLAVIDTEGAESQPVVAIRCTAAGFAVVREGGAAAVPISATALVQCKRPDTEPPSISFLKYSHALAVLLGVLGYAVLFGGLTFGCRIGVGRWRKRVEAIGPLPVAKCNVVALTASTTNPAQELESMQPTDGDPFARPPAAS